MATRNGPNRWWITFATVMVMFPIGGIYSWSVFVDPLQDRFDYSWTEAMLPLMANVGMIVVGTVIGGRIQDRIGPRYVAAVGIVAYSIAVALAALAGNDAQLWILILTYGILGGTAVGVAYITAPAMITKWFPDRRGMAAGIATMGFGAGAVLTAPLAEWLLDRFDELPPVFLVLAAVYLVVGLPFCFAFRDPPDDWDPPPMPPELEQLEEMRQYEFKEALGTPQFWLLTIMLFVNVTIGIALITALASVVEDIADVDSGTAALVVIVVGVGNGVGRPGLAALSDRIGRMPTFGAMFVAQAGAFALLPLAGNVVVFAALAFLVGLCFGGGFGVAPAATVDYFGTEHNGAIVGATIVAWSAAGLVGPFTIGTIRDVTDSFDPALYTFAVIAAAAAVVPWFVKPPADRQPENGG